MSTFRLTMHPARDGDCLMLTWGTEQLHHLIVDLGRTSTYTAVRPLLAHMGEVELFVISHIDADHIAGAMPLVRESQPPFQPKRVWFNAREQLLAAQNRARPIEPFSTRQGDKLSKGIVGFEWPWNSEFNSEVVSTDSPEAAAPIELAGRLTIRLLSPNDAVLSALLPTWPAAVVEAAARPNDPDPTDDDEGEEETLFETFSVGGPPVRLLAAEPYAPDDSLPNGSSIAFVAEFDSKRVLLAADAPAELLVASLDPLAASEGGRYRVDLAKLSHHGSRSNTSKRLLDLMDCTRFAFSTHGRHQHPHPQTVALLLANDPDRDKTLYFNYRQPNTEIWESPSLRRWRYRCEMPDMTADPANNGTLVIEI